MTRWVVGTSLLLLAVVGCDDTRAPSGPTGNLGPSPGVEAFQSGLFFAGSKPDLDHRRYTTQVNFGTLRDLWTRVALPGMSQVQTVKLKFITPRGWLFRTHTVHFSPDANMKTTDLPGVDHPVDVFPAKALPGGYVMDFGVPIGGTPFTKFPEPGAWQIRAEVQGLADELSSPLLVEVHR